MQVNVIEILTAADRVSGINTVKDRPVIRQDDLPFFLVMGRNWNPEVYNTTLTHYNGAWEYQCLIGVQMQKGQADDLSYTGADFVQAETLFDAFCSSFLGDGEWQLIGEVDFGAYAPSGREVIGVAFTLAKQGMKRYG